MFAAQNDRTGSWLRRFPMPVIRAETNCNHFPVMPVASIGKSGKNCNNFSSAPP